MKPSRSSSRKFSRSFTEKFSGSYTGYSYRRSTRNFLRRSNGIYSKNSTGSFIISSSWVSTSNLSSRDSYSRSSGFFRNFVQKRPKISSKVPSDIFFFSWVFKGFRTYFIWTWKSFKSFSGKFLEEFLTGILEDLSMKLVVDLLEKFAVEEFSPGGFSLRTTGKTISPEDFPLIYFLFVVKQWFPDFVFQKCCRKSFTIPRKLSRIYSKVFFGDASKISTVFVFENLVLFALEISQHIYSENYPGFPLQKTFRNDAERLSGTLLYTNSTFFGFILDRIVFFLLL